MPKQKNPAAVALAARRMIVLTQAERTALARHAGASRMQTMTRAQRQAVGRAGAAARWAKYRADEASTPADHARAGRKHHDEG